MLQANEPGCFHAKELLGDISPVEADASVSNCFQQAPWLFHMDLHGSAGYSEEDDEIRLLGPYVMC